jgi:glycosyltransferase involved in cell wall biosynthesis
MQNSKTKILVVCMLDSIHTARWLEQFRNKNLEFHLFPSTPNRGIHLKIANLSKDRSITSSYSIHSKIPLTSIIIWSLDLILKNRVRGFMVSRLIKKHDIKIIHAMELNHAGYIVDKAITKMDQEKLFLISTVWGSDIFWFKQFPKHKELLKKILSKSDLLISECIRDKRLAEELEFKGKFYNSPSLFGFSEEKFNSPNVLPSKRNVILVKGYESFAGRASISLEAISQLKSLLTNYEIHVYSATWKTRKIIKKLNKSEKLGIIFYKKKALTGDEMLSLFKRSRIHIGVSLSDGVPASLLESLVSGAFPIQTNTSCAEQWIKDKSSGLIVAPELDQVRSALKEALINDELVDSAAEINFETAKNKLIDSYVSERISSIYQTS